jgi:hypothetical protein
VPLPNLFQYAPLAFQTASYSSASPAPLTQDRMTPMSFLLFAQTAPTSLNAFCVPLFQNSSEREPWRIRAHVSSKDVFGQNTVLNITPFSRDLSAARFHTFCERGPDNWYVSLSLLSESHTLVHPVSLCRICNDTDHVTERGRSVPGRPTRGRNASNGQRVREGFVSPSGGGGETSASASTSTSASASASSSASAQGVERH